LRHRIVRECRIVLPLNRRLSGISRGSFCPARQIALLDGEPKMIKYFQAAMLSTTLVAAATIAAYAAEPTPPQTQTRPQLATYPGSAYSLTQLPGPNVGGNILSGRSRQRVSAERKGAASTREEASAPHPTKLGRARPRTATYSRPIGGPVRHNLRDLRAFTRAARGRT
jgi:hypothetical protein